MLRFALLGNSLAGQVNASVKSFDKLILVSTQMCFTLEPQVELCNERRETSFDQAVPGLSID
jgi:hypothetical protein